MLLRSKSVNRLFAIFFLIAVPVWPALGKDVFLTIGGGYDPSGNQISLENNVIFVQRMLKEKFPDQVQHEIYFSDGDEPYPDLQYRDSVKEKKCPTAHRLMSGVLVSADSVGLCYRNHQIADVAGPTELVSLRRRFQELGRELQTGDRLFIYVTGHGGAADSGQDYGDYDYEYDEENRKWVASSAAKGQPDESDQFNTSLYFWDSESVTAREFNRWLDELAPEVNVVLVMVQCYSGGFANAIFHRHDPELGLAPHRRCGFFSQVHDRGAAGCTPEVNEADYQEYSTFFWAALGGKTRLGEKIDPPDFDADGKISLAEAHAYVVIESDTIDIPVRTSEALLRRYSRLGSEGNADEETGEKSPAAGIFGFFSSIKKAGAAEGPEPLLDASGPLAEFVAKARPDQRAILEQLAEKLELVQPITVEAIRLKLRQAQSDGSALTIKQHAAGATLGECESELKEDVCRLWPELNEGFSPLTAELTSVRAAEFSEKVEALPSYTAWLAAKKSEDKLTKKMLQAQNMEARVQRLLRTIENVAYAENLARCAPTDVVNRYQAMVALEEDTLNEPADNAPTELAKE